MRCSVTLKSFEVVALSDRSVGERNTGKNAVFLLIVRCTSEQKVRIEENADDVAALYSLSGSVRNMEAATKSHLSQQLEKDGSRYLTTESQPLSDEPGRRQHSVRGAVFFRLVHEMACVVDFGQEVLESSVTLWAIASRRELA